jgi:hypothetical protein
MAPPYTLYYDGKCPVCKSFAKLLRQKLTAQQLELVALQGEQADKAEEFFLDTPSGRVFGYHAAQTLEQAYPQIKEYFFMLPSKYRHEAYAKTYALGRWLRTILRPRHKRKCDC